MTAMLVCRRGPAPRSFRGLALTLVLLSAVLVGAPAAGIAQGNGPVPQTDTLPATGVELRPASILDAPVSRTAYPLGPGDEVALSIFGDVNRMHLLPVTPEGKLVVPALGVVDVLGLSLDEAEMRARSLVARYYRNVEVSLTLARVRQIKVFVVGDVEEPGVRIASTATRASEIVPNVGQDGVLHRNILLRRGSGEDVQVDLARFRYMGDLSTNPTLREGDALVVPPLQATVQIFGRVAFPGKYAHRPGEALAELLSLANGAGDFPADAADTVRVARFTGPEEREIFAFSRDEAIGARGMEFTLAPFDAVYVPARSNFMQQTSASVEGQVVRPGTYPIDPFSTTVCDLVRLAGGFTTEASLVEATLRRRPQSSRGTEELASVPPDLLGERDRQILQIRATGDETNVVADFGEGCTADSGDHPQLIAPGDRLIVPRRRDEVIVLGAVSSPGIVQYVPGQDPEYFVALAGGYTRRADRGAGVVLKAKLGTRIDLDEARSLSAGDMIIIPYRQPRSFMDTVRDVNAVVSPVATLLVTIVALARYF